MSVMEPDLMLKHILSFTSLFNCRCSSFDSHATHLGAAHARCPSLPRGTPTPTPILHRLTGSGGCCNRCPLLQFGFWRVMLDEAQLVAATSSVAAQMTSSLWRRHAWVVTGTPITTRLDEIQVGHLCPCYATLRYAMLCYAMLCYAIPTFPVLTLLLMSLSLLCNHH